ncbi:hypothetical protein HX798_28435 [Pseudomonas putida]|uniref:Capsular biosynthesis protein n=1 Tax=Pseudomonas putida TaxID=303 RepID=A0A7Y7ZFR7_PSEPU|nr:hypothetical protein [Pseudomonas putida]NWC84181.1 hypothetical protein [Pseudomonas putida]
MIVINSAAYVVSEFRTEFGRIPACLLPLGNKKLLEYQVSSLRRFNDDRIVVSLPDDYLLTIDEQRLFDKLSIEVTFVPVGIQLAQALLFVLNTVSDTGKTLRILHGDTLLDHIPSGEDLIAVAATHDDYNWEKEIIEPDREIVWCGYFALSSAREFIRSLALAQGDFVKAVKLYSDHLPLERIEIDGWHDLGHVNTYFVSRSKITTQRIFNSLVIADGTVWKSGSLSLKIFAESEWFRNLPIQLRKYIPQLINAGIDDSSGNAFYQLEYLPTPPLNEAFVHGKNPSFFWKRIFCLMSDFFSAARASITSEQYLLQNIATDAHELYKKKTISRLKAYALSANIDFNRPTSYAGRPLPSINDIANICIEKTLALQIVPAVLHGDFCLSNILFDSRSAAIKVIDPRGVNLQNEPTIYGDQKYDLAKVAHSIIGLYDFIISGRYEICKSPDGYFSINFNLDERLISIQQLFLDCEFVPGLRSNDVMPLTVLLFLSMLPLHSDRPDRQEAMLINAVRLYSESCT